jgi:NADPH:quinone reductase
MKAMVIRAFGGPEVFEAQELPTPTPNRGQVLVRVKATSINPVDYKLRRDGNWANVQPPAILGNDVAFKPGDELYYLPGVFSGQGSYAQYHVADEAIVARKPANLSFVEAASLPLAGSTAYQGLIGRLALRPGETILIHGGAGGVGSLAVQIAHAIGATVFATASQRNVEFVSSLGAARVIDYHQEDFTQVIRQEAPGGVVDAVFDTVGGDLLARSVAITRLFGRMAGISGTTDLNAAFGKNLTMHFIFVGPDRAILNELRQMVEAGQVKPVVESVLPLDQVAEAQTRLEQGGGRGKIVLTVD